MNEETNIDQEHTVCKKINDCSVQIFFKKNYNPEILREIKRVLVNSFEQRFSIEKEEF